MKMTVFRHMALAALCVAGAASAQSFENIDRLERELLGALRAGIGEPGGPAVPIDRRLKLAQCPDVVTFDPVAMGAVAVRCPALGWRIRVPLTRVSSAAQVSEAPVIRRGDPVEIVAGGRFFQVSTQAIAEQDGAPGARIRVRSAPKSPPVVAEVVKAGVVRLPD